MKTLRKGATGPDVTTLYQALTAAGYDAGGAPFDVFGPGIESAVMDFQGTKGLVVDGVVGTATWAALDTEHTPEAPEHPVDLLISNGIAHRAGRLNLTNYGSPNVAMFAESTYPRAAPITEIELHESVGYSLAGAVSTLHKKGCGVQLAADADGSTTQHGDLALSHYIHAGRHNGHSVGLEVINPYYGSLLRPAHPWKRVLSAPWAHKGKYVVPTQAQAEAVFKLCRRLTSGKIAGLKIPRVFRGLEGGRLAMGRIAGADQPSPGIHAHYYSAHSDGAWPALYVFLRMVGQLEPFAAWLEACNLAEGARGSVDVAAYMEDR